MPTPEWCGHTHFRDISLTLQPCVTPRTHTSMIFVSVTHTQSHFASLLHTHSASQRHKHNGMLCVSHKRSHT